ncbi:DNA repair protein RadC [Candidatus Woesearchaeota archaeon]|nr:DNA repair protein RadC [Candidatus Woesearchaeota archaeon]
MKAIRHSNDVYKTMDFLSHENVEYFFGIYLGARNNILKVKMITKGIADHSIIHPREILRPAINLPCCAFIVVHNHPSGDPQPSEQDQQITESLHNVAKIFDIPLLDHVIVGKSSYYSFKDAGLIV